jgi:hypothetical protein
MFKEARIFTREQRIDKKRRDFIQRHLEPVRAGQPAVDFPIHVENRVPFRHLIDVFQVERLRPRGVKHQHAEDGGDGQRD